MIPLAPDVDQLQSHYFSRSATIGLEWSLTFTQVEHFTGWSGVRA